MSDCDVMALIRSGRESKTSSLHKKKRVYFLIKAIQRAQMQTLPPCKDRQWKLLFLDLKTRKEPAKKEELGQMSKDMYK